MVTARRTPLADRVAEDLHQRIRSGEWPVGARLPGEMRLAAELGVGRSTIREAIRRLVGRGVLESRQGAGTFLVSRDGDEEWGRAVRDADIVAVVEARIAIEAEAAALAAERRTSADLRRLRNALADRGRRRDGGADLVDVDMAFHRAVVAASHNAVLIELFDVFMPRLREAMQEMVRSHPRFDRTADHDRHVRLVDAVAERDPRRAARESRTHLVALRARLLGEGPAVSSRP